MCHGVGELRLAGGLNRCQSMFYDNIYDRIHIRAQEYLEIAKRGASPPDIHYTANRRQRVREGRGRAGREAPNDFHI